MENGRIVGIVLLLIGAGLLIYGFQAGDSVSSGFSNFFQGAPSNKAILLVSVGALVAVYGLVKLLRRRTA